VCFLLFFGQGKGGYFELCYVIFLSHCVVEICISIYLLFSSICSLHHGAYETCMICVKVFSSPSRKQIRL
jgi:hypothetical protein